MVRRLAHRAGAIVTVGASCCDTSVIKGGTRKTHRLPMAVSARRSGDQMVGRFTDGDRAIVAGGAWSGRLNVVDVSQVAPRRCQMAAFALVRRLRVRLRLACSGHRIVAEEALLWRTLEAPVDMARCAFDARMRAGERESGRKMIE